MSVIFQAGFEKEIAPKQERVNMHNVYKERLAPIKSKEAHKIFDKLIEHIDKKANITIDIANKKIEIEELKEQSNNLDRQYQDDFDRETMRAKIEIDGEIELIRAEVKALNRKYNHGVYAWRIELTDQEVQSVLDGYAPHGEKEKKLWADVLKAKEQYVKSMNAFKEEYEKNTHLHNTVQGLLKDQANRHDQFNRVSEHELHTVKSEVYHA